MAIGFSGVTRVLAEILRFLVQKSNSENFCPHSKLGAAPVAERSKALHT